MDDAVAALLLAEPIGDINDGLMRATICLDTGGAAAVWLSQQRGLGSQQQQQAQVCVVLSACWQGGGLKACG